MPLLSQGPFAPTVLADVPTPPNNSAWVNLNDILISNFATCPMDPGGPATDHTDLIYATGYGFTIPANVVVVGVGLAVIHKSLLVVPTIVDQFVQLLKAGVQTGDDKSAPGLWPRGVAIVTYGGSADLWSVAWLPADINDPNFGIAFAAVNTSPVNANDALVSQLSLTVWYTTTPTQAVAIIREA